MGEGKKHDVVDPVVGNSTFGPTWSTEPHVCPVCEGRGEVRRGFYSAQSAWTTEWQMSVPQVMERCKTCSGRGVVWKP